MKLLSQNQQTNSHPSRSGRGWGWLLLLLLCVAVACSDNDDDSSDKPDYLKSGTTARPAGWLSFSDDEQFELRMTVQVQLGDVLADYQSPQDLMCAKIDGEIRAVSGPYETGGIAYFPLIIFDNVSGRQVTLCYYCDRLHRIYTIDDWAAFDASAAPTGDSGFYRPRFTEQ